MQLLIFENAFGIGHHIAVKVIAYRISVERDQTVVGIILEATIGCRCYVTCCIVVEGLGRYNRVIAELLDSSLSDPAEIIISITHFGRICKYLFFDNSRQIIVSVLKSGNYRAGCRSFNGRSHSLLVVVDGGCYTSVGLGNAYYTVVFVISVGSYTVCPVGYTDEIVACVILVSFGTVNKNSAPVSKDGENCCSICTNNIYFYFSVFASEFYNYFFSRNILKSNGLILICDHRTIIFSINHNNNFSISFFYRTINVNC